MTEIIVHSAGVNRMHLCRAGCQYNNIQLYTISSVHLNIRGWCDGNTSRGHSAIVLSIIFLNAVDLERTSKVELGDDAMIVQIE